MSGKGKPLLRVSELSVRFGEVRAVRGLSFELAPGEVLALMGPSGAGKSAASMSLLGLAPADAQVSGSVVLDGVSVLDASPEQLREIRGRRVAATFQDPIGSLNPVMRIGAQIAETLSAHGEEAGREAVGALLHSVGVADAERVATSYPHELSGGLCQRAQIAMAIAAEPALLVADEPTSALDVQVQAEILVVLRKLNRERGMAMLLVTHDPEVVAELADRVLVLDQGEAVESGPVNEVLSAPRDERTAALLEGVRPSPSRTSRSSRSPGTAGRSPDGAAALLEVEGLGKRFGDLRAVSAVTFTVGTGETLAVVGESGSGKTTLARLILGLEAPDEGTIRFAGEELRPLRRSRRGERPSALQMVFQDAAGALNPRRTVAQALPVSGSVDELLRRVGLEPEHAGRFPHELSGGQRQRVGIARALAMRPALIVADEPVSALDAAVRQRILALLGELRDSFGLALVLIAHDLGVVRRVADRVAVMRAGELVEIGAASEVLARPSHPYTQALLAAEPRRAAALVSAGAR